MNQPWKRESSLAEENAELRARLEEAEETLGAIRAGEVDALVMGGQVYTLQGAETPYRILIEAMHEGAATLAPDGTILYANGRLAGLLGTPLEQLIGMSLRRFVAPASLPAFDTLLAQGSQEPCKGETTFQCPAGSDVAAQLAFSPLVIDATRAVSVVATDLTARKGAEDRLRQEHDLLERRVAERTAELQAIFDTVPIGLAIAEDLQGLHIRGNPAVEGMVGVGPGGELSKGGPAPAGYRCLHEGRELAVTELPMQRAARGETVTGQVLDVVRDDGQTVTLYSSASPLLDEMGNPRGAVGAFMDITALKRVEDALKKTHEELETRVEQRTAELQMANAYNRSLIEASLDPLVTIGPDGRITDVNAATEAATGCARGALIGTDFSDYFTEPDRARLGYQQVLAQGQVRDYPLTMRHASGRTTDVLYHATVYRNEAGEVQGVFAAARDVTERRRAEAAVQAERQRLYDVLETLPAMICLLTPDYHVPFANRSFRKWFGESRGRRCYEYCFGRSEPCEFCESFNVLKTGQPHHWEVGLPNGSVIDAYDLPFADADGSPMILEMDIDITDRRRVEAELARYRAHLEELVQQRTAQVEAANAELRASNDELARFNRAMVGRELRMIELKQEVNGLCARIGEAPRYDIDFR